MSIRAWLISLLFIVLWVGLWSLIDMGVAHVTKTKTQMAWTYFALFASASLILLSFDIKRDMSLCL